jgi:hypothetical protein
MTVRTNSAGTTMGGRGSFTVHVKDRIHGTWWLNGHEGRRRSKSYFLVTFLTMSVDGVKFRERRGVGKEACRSSEAT